MQQLVRVAAEARVEPGVPGRGGDDHGHSVVDVTELVGRGRGDDAAGGEPGVVRSLPELVEAGHRQQAGVGGVDEVGLLDRLAALALPGVLPFVVAVRGEQAAAGGEGLAEGRLGSDRLDTGVDQPGSAACVLGPGGHQPPGQRDQLATRPVGAGPLDHRGHLIGRSDVPRGRRHAVEVVHLVQVFQQFLAGRRRVSSAHAATLFRNCDKAVSRSGLAAGFRRARNEA